MRSLSRQVTSSKKESTRVPKQWRGFGTITKTMSRMLSRRQGARSKGSLNDNKLIMELQHKPLGYGFDIDTIIGVESLSKPGRIFTTQSVIPRP